MKRVVLLVLIGLMLCGCEARTPKNSVEWIGLFDTATVLIVYENEREFRRYSELIYKRLTELDHLYDIYHAYEGLNNLYTVNENAGIAPVTVAPEIIGLLSLAKEGYNLTSGTVNIALGSVLRIWHDYREDGVALPPMDLLMEAAQLTDIEDLIIDQANSTVFLRKAGMSLDVGACAKAYAVGLVMQEMGLKSALISAGGNITAIGKPLDGRTRWSIGIQNPDSQGILDTVYLTDRSVSCSGGYQRFFVVDGQVYCHIIDPATLMPSNRYKQVTVIHEDPYMADLLSTAFFILPRDEGATLAAEMGADVLWVGNDGTLNATEGYYEAQTFQ